LEALQTSGYCARHRPSARLRLDVSPSRRSSSPTPRRRKRTRRIARPARSPQRPPDDGCRIDVVGHPRDDGRQDRERRQAGQDPRPRGHAAPPGAKDLRQPKPKGRIDLRSSGPPGSPGRRKDRRAPASAVTPGKRAQSPGKYGCSGRAQHQGKALQIKADSDAKQHDSKVPVSTVRGPRLAPSEGPAHRRGFFSIWLWLAEHHRTPREPARGHFGGRDLQSACSYRCRGERYRQSARPTSSAPRLVRCGRFGRGALHSSGLDH
jgi:hypothetical protein